MSKTYVVPPAPPHNEGKTLAAWVMFAGVVLGSAVAAIGLGMLNWLIVAVGAAIVLATIVASVGLRAAGHGQVARRR
ncbi:hypothetical protein JSY14_00425 [Brachybacterium sp. EF45031]|uniref:HGxxPAAW family protein n=1 Tax=Brachybacterium sillae TaxID=2810536 RepID=UPI00217E8E2F|nr:HGxxPAAW family protein [Brachybacterium sillae]MCS6710558.1 hypothetical protein [Brachybacterium sillae]